MRAEHLTPPCTGPHDDYTNWKKRPHDDDDYSPYDDHGYHGVAAKRAHVDGDRPYAIKVLHVLCMLKVVMIETVPREQ